MPSDVQQPTIRLTDGLAIPQLGYGTYKLPPDRTEAAVSAALEAGYRHVDTATMYGNERAVGRAIKACGSDVFVTTKLNNDAHGRREAREAFARSRDALGVEVVDLYLIHWPLPARDRYVETWRTLLELRDEGAVRAIGVSNFQPAHLRRLLDETGELPVLNQVEVNPYLTQPVVRAFHREHGIVTAAWSPLARGGALLRDPVITTLADKYGVSAAQVIIRWHLDRGDVVVPKSITPQRIRENADVFGFELDPDDVEAITELDRDERSGSDPDLVS